ncbi:hypothetical protein MCHI_003808 [Candidatus Magnetoovum chiemensis]|nr:hypothetical protein MCHI_003808 [Candidatus Magnetoovum chiemensis]
MCVCRCVGIRCRLCACRNRRSAQALQRKYIRALCLLRRRKNR